MLLQSYREDGLRHGQRRRKARKQHTRRCRFGGLRLYRCDCPAQASEQQGPGRQMDRRQKKKKKIEIGRKSRLSLGQEGQTVLFPLSLWAAPARQNRNRQHRQLFFPADSHATTCHRLCAPRLPRLAHVRADTR